MRKFIISKNDANQRLDKFLQKAVPLLPPALAYKYIRTKRIKINQKRCAASDKIVEGSMIELYINDEFFAPENAPDFLSVSADIKIVFEDDNLLIVDKPSGLVVHEDDENTLDTLINRILKYLFEKGEYDYNAENSFVPSLCNRIDRNTQGLVIAAKNADTLRFINEKIREGKIRKLYYCVAHGIFEKKSGRLTDYMLKDSAANRVSIVKQKTPDSRIMITGYRVIAEKNGLSLVEVELFTGRTHQIRAHLASIGHPLVGDTKYGTAKNNKSLGFNRQLLCSYKIIFDFKSGNPAFEYLEQKTVEIKDIAFFNDFLDCKL